MNIPRILDIVAHVMLVCLVVAFLYASVTTVLGSVMLAGAVGAVFIVSGIWACVRVLDFWDRRTWTRL